MAYETETSVPTPTAESPFRVLIRELHAKLTEILTLEDRETPVLAFGKVEWNRHVAPPRIVWVHRGGHFGIGATATNTGGTDSSVGAIIATPQALIQTRTDEELLHIVARLWMASTRLASPNRFDWLHGRYDYPTEESDSLDKAQELILTLPIEIPAPAEYEGERALVECADTQLRAGLEDELDTTTPGQPQFDVNEWV